MEKLNELESNKTVFFNFMKVKYPVFYKSNLFLRDLQYAIISYFKNKDVKVKYPEAEKLALSFTESLVKKNDLIQLNNFTWKLNFSLESGVNQVNNGEQAQS